MRSAMPEEKSRLHSNSFALRAFLGLEPGNTPWRFANGKGLRSALASIGKLTALRA